MEKKILLCIGRQVGSGAIQIAKLLSEELNIPLYDKEIISYAAEKSGYKSELFDKMDEKKNSSLFASFLGRSSNSQSFGFNSKVKNYMDNEDLFAIQSDAVRSIAEDGSAIFVGRCADYILREDPATISIFITADIEDRVKRVAERLGITESSAQSHISQSEKKRTAYYNYYTFKQWGDSSSYDLCVNSSRLGLEGTAKFIIDYIKSYYKI